MELVVLTGRWTRTERGSACGSFHIMEVGSCQHWQWCIALRQFPQLASATHTCLYLALPLSGGAQLLQVKVAYLACFSFARIGGCFPMTGFESFHEMSRQFGHRRGKPSPSMEGFVNPGKWMVGECRVLVGRGRLGFFCLGDVCDGGGADCSWSGETVVASPGGFLVGGVGSEGTRSETAVGASLL